MVGEVFAGISAFKTMLDIAKSMKDMSDTAARQGAVIALQEHILSAQEAQSTLSERVSSLKAELAKLETWDAEKQKYELKSLGANSLAYMLRPDARGTKPPHWVCTNCYADRRISIIQPCKKGTGTAFFGFACTHCETPLRVTSFAQDSGGGCKWLD